MACTPCNQEKGNKTAAEYGHPAIQAKAKRPLKDAAAVNATRWAIWRMLDQSGLPLETGTGGRTKFNRRTQGYVKTHWIDAACVGASGQSVHIDDGHVPLMIRATGRQSRLMCRPDRSGFPRTGAKAGRVQRGFQTGDIVKAVVATGKKAGTYIGRVAVRASGSFNITTEKGTVQGIGYKHCVALHKSDGYTYMKGEGVPPHSYS